MFQKRQSGSEGSTTVTPVARPATDAGGLNTPAGDAATIEHGPHRAADEDFDPQIEVWVGGRQIPPTPPHIGRYVALARIAEGGMGVVYSGYDPDLHRKVAIKLVREDLGWGSGQSRVLQEAQAMARVAHPNVVNVYEVGQYKNADDGRIFIAMEFVQGSSLAQWQRQHPPKDAASFAACLRVYLQAAAGLAAAHRSGLIHRDFKPDNVLVGDDGRARVVDFGLARAVGQSAQSGSASRAAENLTSGNGRLTQVGAILGTPGYMAPEHVLGAEADARSDQFSYCASLYGALYGKLPFAGLEIEEYVNNILAGAFRPPPSLAGGVEVPIVIQQALRRGLSRDPADRFASINALIAELSMGLLPDSDAKSLRRNKNRFRAIFVSSFSIATVSVMWALISARMSDLRPNAILAWAFASAAAATMWWFRKKIYLQPGYRRLGYFSLTVTSYLVVGRTIGFVLGFSAERFLIQEMVGLAALMASEISYVGRRYVWPILVCAISIALQIAWPAGRKLHLNVAYALIVFLGVYLHLRREPGVGK